MAGSRNSHPAVVCPLSEAAKPSLEKVLNPEALNLYGGITIDTSVLVILAAGKGTRFGQDPKCIQPVHGVALARHSINAFRHFSTSPVICLTGYRHLEVSAALGKDNIYIQSDNPTGGTAYAAFEAFGVPDLLEKNPLLIITMGDRIVPSSIFRRLRETHRGIGKEADLTFLTAIYQPPKNHGKGRVLRNEEQKVLRIIEERDIAREEDTPVRQALLNLTEGNCPLYAIHARDLYRHLAKLTNANAQGQYYLTDLIEAVSHEGGDIRTITTTVTDPEYDLLCSDVTQAMDLALLEGILASSRGLLFPEEMEVEQAANSLQSDRPAGQVESIARQLGDLVEAVQKEKLAFEPGQPVGIGISGGRLRIAFMHPDMARFHGPAWQMPIGGYDAVGEEQIVVLVQRARDRRIHLYPLNPKYRENINSIACDDEIMYPGEEIADLHSYEQFGTRMSENLLLSLGYFSDEELENRRRKGQPLPPTTLWAGSNMRRPFALVGNAIASMRTLRAGNLGAKVQEYLGREGFRGLRLVSTGDIPQGGFASSSAMTVATKNAINALYGIGIPPDLLVHLACQAEYGTGVRAGSLDQATEQKGLTSRGTLISSNPKDNYRIIGTYPVPSERFQIIFPYSVERDRNAWRWSWGTYGEIPGSGPLTTAEMRKVTGKAAEICAILTHLPFETDFFKVIEEDLVCDGQLEVESSAWIRSILLKIPLLVKQDDLRERLNTHREWYVGQLMESGPLDVPAAEIKTETTFTALLAGWRDPVLRHTTSSGQVIEEEGVPLRAMLAYLFGEVAKNFYLIHHPEQWIECVSRSQRGDCCVDIDPDRLPEREQMEGRLAWEEGAEGPELMARWLDWSGAVPFDYNRGLDDESLSQSSPPEFHRLQGSNFFRGLALIDLAEAMLKRAFGEDAVAVRVNAAGQGDFFQVHVDTHRAAANEVKQFLRNAFYSRFGLSPSPEFVEIHPGGGALGVRMSRYDLLTQLHQRLLRDSLK